MRKIKSKNISLNEIEDQVNTLQAEVDSLEKGEQGIFNGISGLYENYLLKNYDVAIDLEKNLLTVSATIFAATFAVNVKPQTQIIFGVLTVINLLALNFTLSKRFSIATKNAERIEERITRNLDRLEKRSSTAKSELKILSKRFSKIKRKVKR